MAVINNGLPATNLKAEDIRDTLNANGGSVTNDILTFFKANAKSNKWSKWKPQHVPNEDFVDDEATFKRYNWGIEIAGLRTRDADEAFNGSTESEWVYNLPKGGSASPYRLGDFRNYRADATSPFRELEVSHVTAVPNEEEGITVTLWCRMFNDSNEKGMLGLNDIGDFSGFKVAFLHKKPNSNTVDYIVSEKTIASNHGSVSATFDPFSNASSEKGVHTYMAALYNNGDFYRLPIAPKTVTVEESKLYDKAVFSGMCGYDAMEASLTYLRGTSNTTSLTITPTFYFGTQSNPYAVSVKGSKITVAVGKTERSVCTIDKYQNNRQYWNQIYNLAVADNLYMTCDYGDGQAVKVDVTI